MPPNLNILVVGGGIAGPSAAYWLSRGLPRARVTLVERSPAMRATGQQLDIRAAGVDAMRRMGIEAAVRAVRVREPGTQLIDVTGRCRAYFPAAEHGGGRQSITSDYEIMRGDLVRVLYGLTDGHPRVEHVYGVTVQDFTQQHQDEEGEGKVRVVFSDGRRGDYDLVIAADGTGSKTRRIMLGPDAPDPRHRTGGYIAYFSTASRPGDSDRSTACQLPGGRMARTLLTRKDCAELTRVYMMVSRRDAAVDAALQSGDLAALKRALADIYAGAGWETPRFMEALVGAPEADDLYCTPYEEVRLPEGDWSRGRVVLVGDAAHSGTANGYGTSWGLIGPYLLAGELATRCERDGGSLSAAAIREAAQAYEKMFRPIALSGHGGHEWLGSILPPRSAIGIEIMHRIAGAMAYLRLDKHIGFDGAVGKWKLPEYPALERERASD